VAVIGVIVLDSTPLGLLLQRPGVPVADACRNWATNLESRGSRIVLPEIIDYEIRRELKRINAVRSLLALDQFIAQDPHRLLELTHDAMEAASTLWASSRKAGRPLADPAALDIDVILAAQTLTAGFDMSDTIVATSNVAHLQQLVPARFWNSV
jgi:hypothetical protein